jgi:hypothetical protein
VMVAVKIGAIVEGIKRDLTRNWSRTMAGHLPES